MSEDFKGLVPNKISVVIEDFFIYCNEKTTPEMLKAKIDKAVAKGSIMGCIDLRFELDEKVKDEWGNTDPILVLKGTRFETVREMRKRRESYLVRQLFDYHEFKLKYNGDDWNSMVKEMKALGWSNLL